MRFHNLRAPIGCSPHRASPRSIPYVARSDASSAP
jgi:hypothetical protein